MDLNIRAAKTEEVPAIYKLEIENFPDDEAYSHEVFLYRHRVAPDLMLGGYIKQDLIGFISATRYHGQHLTKESMSMHTPNGESVCIHSVVVHKDFRRKGIALELLQEFIQRVKTEQRGKDTWYELQINVNGV